MTSLGHYPFRFQRRQFTNSTRQGFDLAREKRCPGGSGRTARQAAEIMNSMQGMNARGPNHFMPGSTQIQRPVCEGVTLTDMVFYRAAAFEFPAGRYAFPSPNGVLMHKAPV